MTTFDIVDLQAGAASRGGDRVSREIGNVDTHKVTQQLESLRNDVDQLFNERGHLGLKSVTIKLAITAEGKVAFIAKGTIDASVEVVFERGTGPVA